MNFVWYDFETFGLNPKFDAIAQCAFVATDSRLEVEDRLHLQICPPQDKLIHPYSLCVTGLSLNDLQSQGITEWQAAGRIHNWLQQKKGVLAGFNSAAFDSVLLRFLFFRNLLPAYKHEQNFRKADVLQWLRAIYALEPDDLHWDMRLGALSLTQAGFCEANSISSKNAHDAMADTLMMLELVRFLAKKKPRVMQHFLFKHSPEYISQEFAQPTLGILIDKSRGWKKQFARTVVCGQIDRKTLLWLDVESASEIVELLHTSQEEEFLSQSWQHVRYLKLNDCPIILPWKVITKERAARLGYEPSSLEKQAKKLLELFPKIAGVLAKRSFPEKSSDELQEIDVDSLLYLQRDYFDYQQKIAWLHDKLQLQEKLQDTDTQALPDWLHALYSLALFRETGEVQNPAQEILQKRLYGKQEPNYMSILKAHCHLAEAFRFDSHKQELLQESRDHLEMVKSFCRA